jgi:hypothetical protein
LEIRAVIWERKESDAIEGKTKKAPATKRLNVGAK